MGSFPDIEQLRQRGAAIGYLASAEERAGHLQKLLAAGLRQHLPSGQFAEVRSLLNQAWFAGEPSYSH